MRATGLGAWSLCLLLAGPQRPADPHGHSFRLAGRLHASFEVFIEPPVLVVEHGGAVRLKCRTTCQDPSATGDVETSFFKHRLEASGQGETVVELRNITEWSSNILCFYSCNKQRKTVSATLIAYRPLEQAVLEPVPQLAVGESHELVCRVPRVAPVRNLTVILRRGATTLHTATFELRAENKPQDVEVTHVVTARREDQGQSITCQALLDLRPSNVHFNTTSSPQVLDVYDFPEDPRLEMSEIYLETDEKINVSCRVRQAFPAARFELSLAGHPLPLHVTEDGLRAVAEVSHAQQGKFGLVCSVRVGPKERQKQASVHVYSFPQPQLNVSTSVPMEGTEVTGRCVLPPGHSPDLQLQVTAGPRVLAAWGPSPLVFAWTASEEDDDTKLVCEARMRAGNKPTKRSTPVGLSVTALPRMDDRSCPPSQNWTEGEEVTLRCQARGNPRPHVACDKDGTSITPGLRHVATRAHTGTFRCRASNALGMAERSITVWVQYHDVDVVLIVVLVLVALGALVIAGVVYGIYYRKKKMREYQLQKQQRRMEMERLRSEETVGINGSAPGSQPYPSPGCATAAPPGSPFSVSVTGNASEVSYGGTVLINCSTTCADPNAIGGVETSLTKEEAARGCGWLAVRLNNVTEPLSEVLCFFTCFGQRNTSVFRMLAYDFPQPVLLLSDPNATCNQPVTLRCSAAPSRPPRLQLRLRSHRLPPTPWQDGPLSLELTAHEEDDGDEFVCEAQLLVGTQMLNKSSDVVKLHVTCDASVAVSHLLTVGPGDHGQDVPCHAELSLRPHGPLFARAAVPVKLAVYALPEPPQLQAPVRLEAGTAANASCRVVGAFPAEDAHFALVLDGRSLDVAVTEAGDTLTASTRLSPRTAGLQELNCTVAVGAAARTARARLHVYRFPAPVLELSPVPAGGEVTVTCRAAAAEPPAVRLQLRDADGGVLAEGPQPQLELRLVAQREDDGRWFGCRASLAVGDGTVTKDTEARLAVLYMPEMEASSCPSNRTWLQGTREALSCGATGNPTPTVTCTRDGATVSTHRPELVTRSRAGTYLCNATNSLGTRSRLINVRVEYEPSLTESGCPAHRTWVEGERRELACRAEGDPAPSTRCTRDEGPPSAGGGRAVSRSDAGRYTCRATNKHGSALRSVYVSVEYEPSIGEAGCPARRLWVEGTAAELGCNASGNPLPHVACTKLGDPHAPPASPNVTRAHAGTYQCRATNAHGSALRNITITVEYSPVAVSLRVVPSANVSRGASFSVECRAEGLPAPTFGWALPPAPNLRFGADNRSVAVARAAAANRGVYTCTASNRHGRRAGSVVVRVDESRLALLVSLGVLGAVTVLGLAAAGIYYLKTTACKKGEYNVRDAEGTSEGARLHQGDVGGRGEVFGIQLTPT
nr:intercellular adhesion molecule 5-like [Anser cygnoides]